MDTELRWTKLAWLNEDLLQIDASDTTYATVVAGSGTFRMVDTLGVASANDCTGKFTAEGVIDLRGTRYVIAGVDDTPCSKTCSGGHCTTDASDASASICFQWIAYGWHGTVSVTCSDGNQRCVVRCGGGFGGCKPIGNMLQLAWLPSPPPSPPPAPPLSHFFVTRHGGSGSPGETRRGSIWGQGFDSEDEAFAKFTEYDGGPYATGVWNRQVTELKYYGGRVLTGEMKQWVREELNA